MTASERREGPPKVLAILGSPRKGNSYRVTQEVEAALRERGEVACDYLWLKDANPRPCRGCYTCQARGEHLCPLEDDRDAILQRMLEADGVILVSPVYAWSVTALTKSFVERFAYLSHRPPFVGKVAMVVATSSGSGLGSTLDYLAAVAESWGFRPAARLGVALPPLALSQAYRAEVGREIARAADRFALALFDRRPRSPSLRNALSFRLMRAIVLEAAEHLPFDNQYWREHGWLDRPYYSGADASPLYRPLGALVETVARQYLRRKYGMAGGEASCSDGGAAESA